jgi:hypothetical protein
MLFLIGSNRRRLGSSLSLLTAQAARAAAYVLIVVSRAGFCASWFTEPRFSRWFVR